MKAKIIPFDLETAKKIQAGEIEGQIKTRCGHAARILCTDLKDAQPVLAAFATHNMESVSQYTKGGRFYISGGLPHGLDLVLEVPDNEPQFKPFDKVLVRNVESEIWRPSLYAREDVTSHYRYECIGCKSYHYCIPYEGNECLVGTTDKPKEE